MEDKRLQKIPEYSLEKIIKKSDLASRGLQELGLFKNKKHYTIIYVCQFCGRLVNFCTTPCIYCGKSASTKREIVIANALSSESMSLGDQLQTCSLVKTGKDLELEIHRLREIIDKVLDNWDSEKTYHTLMAVAEDVAKHKDAIAPRTKYRMAMTKAVCLNCGKSLPFIHDVCEGCKQKFTEQQKLILAIKQILEFAEIFLDDESEDEESLEELIFVLVSVITRAVEKNELPEQELLGYIYELLHKVHYIISRSQDVGVSIKDGNASRIGGSDGDAKTKEDWLSVLLAMNVDYLLHLYKPGADKKVISFSGDEFQQIFAVAEPLWQNGDVDNPPEFVIFMGGIGSGKTTIRRHELAKGFVHFDTWEVYTALKKSFGEKEKRLADYSNFASDMILKQAISENRNIVIEIIGDNYDQITPVIDKMKGIGYNVSVKAITADPGVSYERHLKAVQDDKDYMSSYYTQDATLAYFYSYFNLGAMPKTQE
jgi:hypothetical protein